MARRQSFMLGLAAALLGLLLTACGAAPAAEPTAAPAAQRPTRDTESSTSNKPTAESAPTSAPAEEAPTAAAVGDTLALQKLDAGLDALASYRMTFTSSVTKTADGSVQTFSYDLSVNAAGDQRVVFSADDGTGTEQPVEMVTVGGRVYLLLGSGADAQCISSDATAGEAFVAPSDMLGGFDGGEVVERNVEVNGVRTDHYVVREPLMLMAVGGGGDARVDAWVARDGGYLVRYVGIVSGDEVIDGAAGAMSWAYDIAEVDRIATIEIPAVCAAQAEAAGDLILPEDAANVTTMGGMTLFTTAEDVTTVTDFYVDRLSADGWNAVDRQELAGMSILKFSKDGRTMSLTITSDDNTTTVMITQE